MINQQRHEACDSARSQVLSAIFGIREQGMNCLHAKTLLVANSVARIKGSKDETPPVDRIRTRVNVNLKGPDFYSPSPRNEIEKKQCG
jgi:hypothetical protein